MPKRKPKKKASSRGEVELHLDEKSKKTFYIIGGLFAGLLVLFIILEMMK